MWKIPSWEGFDLYWRYTWDESNPEAESKDGQHISAYESIRGSQWFAFRRGTRRMLERKLLFMLSMFCDARLERRKLNCQRAWRWIAWTGRSTSTGGIKARTPPSLPHAESDPLHRDILSLLAIRHLNRDSILHRDTRNHYLEMFVCIRNAGDDVKGLFDRPSRHVEGDTDINNLSKGGYAL